MQLILQSETLSEDNRKMSAMEVSEPITGKPVTEEIHQRPYSELKLDGNVTKQMVEENSCSDKSSEDSDIDKQETEVAKEVSSNGNNSKDNNSDDKETISKEHLSLNDSNENDINDLQLKSHKEKAMNFSSNSLESRGANTCNGDVVVNLDEKPTKQSENNSENSVANKDSSSLKCDNTGINEKMVVDSSSSDLFNEPASKNIPDNSEQNPTSSTVSGSLSQETSDTTGDNSEKNHEELASPKNTDNNYDSENVPTEIELDSEILDTNTSKTVAVSEEVNQTNICDNTSTQDKVDLNIHDKENNDVVDILSKQTDIISNNLIQAEENGTTTQENDTDEQISKQTEISPNNLIQAEKNGTTTQEKDTDERTRLLPEVPTPNESLVNIDNVDESEDIVNNDTISTSHEQIADDENEKNTEQNTDVKSEPLRSCNEIDETPIILNDNLESHSASNESINTLITNTDSSIITKKISAVNDVSTQECNESVSDVEINSEVVKECDNTTNDKVSSVDTIEECDTTNDKVSSVDTVEGVLDACQSTKDILDENRSESPKSDKNKEDELMDVDSIENLNDKSKSNSSTSDEKTNNTESLSVPLENNSTEAIKEMLRKSTLSQTLDILSDSDDESEQSTAVKSSENQCVDLIDDDDVMLVDDDCSSDQREKGANTSNLNTLRNNTESSQEIIDTITKSDENNKDSDIHKDVVSANPENSPTPSIQSEATTIQKKLDDAQSTYKPKKNVVPVDITSYCKPLLAEMTRDQLEEFCLQTIVQGIVDRSYFSEVKTKFKTMVQNAEEWRKKVMMLSKQNRDLQIVLKTVQEEQKKRPTDVIAPLRITRSVGMQVYMVEPNRADAGPGRPRRAHPAGRPRGAAPPAGPAPAATRAGVRGPQPGAIPVPRLVPASNAASSPVKIAPRPPTAAATPAFTRPPQPQLQSSAISSNTGRNAPPSASAAGGGASSPAQPPTRPAEKRPLSTNGGGGANSVTVDLTDDEPPAKQPARAVGGLRVVPQQQLVGPPRASGPRKVYIPISGTQTQPIRPGQTIMFKNIAPPSPRPRNPGGVWTGNMVRLAPRPGLRHPAPLPDAPKQAQPPNWKALPPAPDLKISKVENGIVISWKIDGYQAENWEEIASYQLYAYQETGTAPSTMLWKKIGDVKALPLPMACTLTQFMAGYKYYFAVRAVDIRSRIGPFSLPGSILLLNK